MNDRELRTIAEYGAFKKIIIDNPTGIISIVSDTFDIWQVLTEFLPRLKNEILARDGKLVIRPDSGDPVDIMCGEAVESFDLSAEAIEILIDSKSSDTPHTQVIRYDDEFYEIVDGKILGGVIPYDIISPEQKGVIEILWDIFGGTITSTGYKKLNEKVGAIYGDSINIDRADRIDERMMNKGFATTNYVLGVGSYSLQYVTRDTHGFAQKATYVEVNGVGIEIFKDPITDSGDKKSARGLLAVFLDEDGQYYLKDQATWDEVNSDKNELKIIFEDGKFYNETTLTEIRKRIDAKLAPQLEEAV